MTLSNFKFGKGLGFLNSLVASKAAEVMVAPLEKLKLDAERLVKEYTPPDHVVTELDLTWKGGLWRMALEAALGVQYLHHHRYEQASAKEESRRRTGAITPSRLPPTAPPVDRFRRSRLSPAPPVTCFRCRTTLRERAQD